MSQHRSLKGTSTIAAKRNVLKRFERVELLKKRGQWKEKQKVARGSEWEPSTQALSCEGIFPMQLYAR